MFKDRRIRVFLDANSDERYMVRLYQSDEMIEILFINNTPYS